MSQFWNLACLDHDVHTYLNLVLHAEKQIEAMHRCRVEAATLFHAVRDAVGSAGDFYVSLPEWVKFCGKHSACQVVVQSSYGYQLGDCREFPQPNDGTRCALSERHEGEHKWIPRWEPR